MTGLAVFCVFGSGILKHPRQSVYSCWNRRSLYGENSDVQNTSRAGVCKYVRMGRAAQHAINVTVGSWALFIALVVVGETGRDCDCARLALTRSRLPGREGGEHVAP